MSKTIYNFNAGPAILPQPVLKKAAAELVQHPALGYSILEESHRSKVFLKINADARRKVAELLGLGSDFTVLFLQGGASSQFYQIPMNLLHGARTKADYVDTGVWASKALKEAKRYGDIRTVFTGKAENYVRIPAESELSFRDDATYVHLCTNNTIYGTQWAKLPKAKAPLILDSSSDILSRPLDLSGVGVIYAGAQKNLGPSGLTVVAIRKDLLEGANADLPAMASFKEHASQDSLQNTPPTFGIYLLDLVMDWIVAQGGLSAIEKQNEKKAKLIYDAIDAHPGVFKGHAVKEARSRMNVTFTLPDEESTKRFLAGAEAEGFVGLAGHRSVGGMRASIYNAFPVEGCEKLAAYMTRFAKG